MKAVIMAGGEGTRLRPLTCDCPKPMARLCGRPVMEYIFDLLGKNGVDEAAVSLRYLPEEIRSHFGEAYGGIRLSYSIEDKPMGTAGGVKLAADTLGPDTPDASDLLVISGDALCDFNLAAAMRWHREKGAAATLLTAHVADPREYGLVVAGPEGRVSGFVEKPGWAQSVTDAVNTGIYILSRQALSLIPPEREFDFAKDLFPLMMERDMPIYAFDADGYWCDIGDVGAYVTCQFDMLGGKVECRIPGRRTGGIRAAELPQGHYFVHPPCYIGKGVRIGSDAHIGPCAVLDDGCTVGAGTSVRHSVLLPDAYVGERCELRGALVCAGASLKKRAGMFEGSVAGAGSVIGMDAAVSPGVRIWPGKRVEDGARAGQNVQEGAARRGLFDDDGISGEVGVDLTPEICAKIGAAAGEAAGGAVGVADDGSHAGVTLKSALAAGVISTGTRLYDFGSCFEALAAFAAQFCGLKLGLMTRSAGSRAVLRATDGSGLPLRRAMERKIESAVATGQIHRCEPGSYGEPMAMPGIRAVYADALARLAPEGLNGVGCEVRSSNRQVQRLLSETLRALGAGEEGLRAHVTASGREVSFFDEEGGYIEPARTLAVACRIAFEAGEDVALPFDAPRALDTLAARYGRRVLRYLSCPADTSDAKARSLAAGQGFVRDGLQSAVHILAYLRRTGARLHDVAAALPPFALTVRAVPLHANPGRVLRDLSPRESGREGGTAPAEGVRLSTRRGSVLLSPLKRGTGMRILAEAADMETADELCAEYEKTLREQEVLDKGSDGGYNKS